MEIPATKILLCLQLHGKNMGYIGMLSNQNASVTKNCLGISTQFLVESVYIPNIDRYHRLIPMATPKMKSCVTKKRAIMNILKIKKRTKEQKKQHQSVGTMPPPKKKWVEHSISLKPPISYLTPGSHSRHLPHQRQCFYYLVD